jgi:sugar phosphate isomerase/epimerase
MRYFSLTTWSLHRCLGPLRLTRWDDKSGTHRTNVQEQPELLSLLALPQKLVEQGFAAADICHFHLPDSGAAYLEQLRSAFKAADVRIYTLLLDYGDISAADNVRRTADLAWLKEWIDRAAILGAERVRVIAGEASPDDAEALRRSAEGLRELCSYAAGTGVRVVTENFRPLTSTADNCLALLESCGEALGLITDFGNFKEPGKLDALARIIPHSEEIHAKAITDEAGSPNAEELRACLDKMRRSDYAGPITVVYDGPGDMWDGVRRVKAIIEPYI